MTPDFTSSDPSVSVMPVSAPVQDSSGRRSESCTDAHPASDDHPPASVDGSNPGLRDGLDQLPADYENLQRRLATMPVIEQAKGLLIGRFGIDADTAFALLRRWSSYTNTKLRDVSGLLIETAARPVDADADRASRPGAALDVLIAGLNAGTLPEQAARGMPDETNR